ncbi:hypothetical protein PENSPDRAFT_695542 [Peniophora sp. CONT]|nr:hypothetical protein PENSPDRAFT_695542 [Peniophora sp. CONT]
MSSWKPYQRIYAPLSIRQELPPSPTPSPTGFIESMRVESAPLRSSGRSGQAEGQSETTVADATPTTVGRDARGDLSTVDPPPFQAHPTKVFDVTHGIKIPRPSGVMGKPSAGGYTLSVELSKHGWSKVEYQAVQTALHRVAKNHLDKTKPFAKQDPSRTRRFIHEALERFPGLEYFHEEWPARDLATMYLKNSLEKGREGTQEPI